MPTITRSGQCANSPKNQLIEDLVVAMATGDARAAAALVADDVTWETVGKAPVHGIEPLRREVENGFEPAQVNIEHLVSHGKAGAVNGTTTTKDGEVLAFCHMLEFTNTKGNQIRAIKTYQLLQT